RRFTSNGQYDRFTRRVGEFFTIPKRPPDTNIRTDQCYNQLAMRRARSISLIVFCLLAGIQLQAASSKKALEKRVGAFLAQPDLARGFWGIEVVSLRHGKVRYSHNADKLFTLASHTNLLTITASLALLLRNYI